MGWRRAAPEETGALAPRALDILGDQIAQHQVTLLHLVLASIEHANWEANPAPPSSSASTEALRQFLLDVMLYSPPIAAKASPGSGVGAGTAAAAEAPSSPDGLSPEAVERLTGKASTAMRGAQEGPAYIMGRKSAVLKAIQGKLLADADALPVALVASCGAHHEVRRAGEDLARVRGQRADYEDPQLVRTLFHLLLGDPQPAQAGLPSPPPLEARRTPATAPVRALLYANLCRSVRAANSFPDCLRAIFEGLYGAGSTLRTKQGAMQLATWTLKQAEDAVLKPIAGIVLQGLVKFVREMPADIKGGDAAVAQLRGFTYSAIGQVAQRAPQLFAGDVGIASMLFGAFASEAPEVKVSVQEALSLCCGAYTGASEVTKELLMGLLLSSIESPAHQPRFCAVYWANRLFAFRDVRARYVCLLAIGDPKTEVRDEARKGLEPPTAPSPGATPGSLLRAEEAELARARSEARLPAFEDMVAHLCTPNIAQARRAAPAAVKAAMVTFCIRCLADSCSRAAVSKAAYLAEDGTPLGVLRSGAAARMQVIVEDALSAALGGGKGVADPSLARASLLALVDLHAARPDVVAGAYGQRLQWLEAFLFCPNEGTRELVASLYGALAVTMLPQKLQGVMETMASAAAGADGLGRGLDTRLGAVAALGYLLSRGGAAVPLAPRQTAIKLLHALVRDRRADVVSAACKALGLAGLESALPLPVGVPPPPKQDSAAAEDAGQKNPKLDDAPFLIKDDSVKEVKTAGEEVSEELTILDVVGQLGAVLEGKDKENEAYEAAARALGSICISNRQATVLSAAAQSLYSTAGKLRVEEFHLSVGEALACVAGGRAYTSAKLIAQMRMPAVYEDAIGDEEKSMDEWSKAARESMQVDGEGGEGDSCGSGMPAVLSHVMETTLLDGKPQVRAAGAPWLLCLLRHAGAHPNLQGQVAELQQHFTFMLGERSEFVQEVGSRGLGLVYEMCGDDKVRDELVATLAKALMSGAVAAPSKGKGRERDEQVFEEGTLKIDDKALGDGSLTTYKELCTVATELGQPELIYKFLNLAGHQKVWNSRRGAAFGFSFIADQAAERLKPHLPQLVPKLYRYQFDPNEKVQEAMAGLWQTVAPDPAKALEEYLPNIFQELIPSCGSRLWRVREASCMGLANLLGGKRFAQVEGNLVEVYRMSLRAMDDVKETVRKAGLALNRAVAGMCLRLCDPSQSGPEVATKALALVLPLLLEEGISQPAEEVRGAAIAQLAKIARLAGAAIRPFISRIAPVLLESLSSLEPQANTYLQLNADKYNVSAEALERARAAVSKGTPLAETVDICARFADEKGADDMLPAMVPIVRSGVGLPTRMGVAKFIGQLALSHACNHAVRRHSSKLLKTLAVAIGPSSGDRSAVVRQAMAGAAAKVVAVAKETAVEEYVKQLISLYTEAGPEDPAARAAVGAALKEVLASAADAARDFLPLFLPIAFVARFDGEDSTRELFQQVWEEGAGATASGVRLYGAEIAEAVARGLEAPHWSARKCAARAAAAFAGALGEGHEVPRAGELLGPLRAAVGGKIWEGKEEVLVALVAVAAAVPGGLPEQGETSATAIAALIVGEAAKKRSEYRVGALRALTKFLTNRKDDLKVGQLLLESTADLFEADGSDPESSPQRPAISFGRQADEEAHYEARMEDKKRREYRQVALAALAAAFPILPTHHARFAAAFMPLLVVPLRSGEPSERVAAAEAGLSFVKHEPCSRDQDMLANSRRALLEALVACMSTQGPTFKLARITAAGTAKNVVEVCLKQGWGDHGDGGVPEALLAAANSLMSEDDMAVRAAATKLRDAICNKD